MIYSVTFWAAVMLFPQLFAAMFTSDTALIRFTASALRIYYGGMCLFGIQIACQMTFVSTGNAVCSIIVAVIRKFVLLLPLIFLVPHLVSDPTTGVYLAEPIADVLAVTITAVLFSIQFRRAIRRLEEPLVES